jgi:hypothetical protein
MLKPTLAVALATCAVPAALQAQEATTTPTPARISTAVPVQTEKPFVDIAVGFNYLQTDLTNTPGGAASYTMGWYGIPEVHLTKHISAIADFTNFYNWHAGTRENVHGFTGGPAYGFHVHHVDFYGFVEGGAVRDSRLGAVNWDPAAVGGLGFNLKVNHHFGFQVVPGEYVATLLPNGNWQSNYTAKAGIVFTTFR